MATLQDDTPTSLPGFQDWLWTTTALLVGIVLVVLNFQSLEKTSKEPRGGLKKHCRRRNKNTLLVDRHVEYGVGAINQEVHGAWFPYIFFTITQAVAFIKKKFSTMRKIKERKLGLTTCQICGKTVPEAFVVSIYTTEVSKARNPKVKEKHLREVRQQEHHPNRKQSTVRKRTARKQIVEASYNFSSPSSLVPTTDLSRNYVRKFSRGTVMSHPLGLRELPHDSRKCCKITNKSFPVLKPAKEDMTILKNLTTGMLPCSICSLDEVVPPRESLEREVSNPKVLSSYNKPEKLSSCAQEKAPHSDYRGPMASELLNSTVSLWPSLPCEKLGLGAVQNSPVVSAASTSLPSEKEVLSDLASTTSDSVHPTASKSPCMQEPSFMHTCHLSKCTFWLDLSSPIHSPICFVYLQYKVNSHLMVKQNKANKYTKLPFTGLMAHTQSIESIPASPKTAKAQLSLQQLTKKETPFLGNLIRKTQEYPCRKTTSQKACLIPANVQKCHLLYTLRDPLFTIPRDSKKLSLSMPASSHKYCVLQGYTPVYVDSQSHVSIADITSMMHQRESKQDLLKGPKRRTLSQLIDLGELKQMSRGLISRSRDLTKIQELERILIYELLTHLWVLLASQIHSYRSSMSKTSLLPRPLQVTAASLEFSATQNLLLKPRWKNYLENYVKSMQCDWEMPAFQQDAEPSAPIPVLSRWYLDAAEMLISFKINSFLKQDTSTNLENHTQRRYLHSAPELPLEVLRPLRLYLPMPHIFHIHTFHSKKETKPRSINASPCQRFPCETEVCRLETVGSRPQRHGLIESAVDQLQAVDQTIQHIFWEMTILEIFVDVTSMKRSRKVLFFVMKMVVFKSAYFWKLLNKTANNHMQFLKANFLFFLQRAIKPKHPMPILETPISQSGLLWIIMIITLPGTKELKCCHAGIEYREGDMSFIQSDIRQKQAQYKEKVKHHKQGDVSQLEQIFCQAFILLHTTCKGAYFQRMNQQLYDLILTGSQLYMNDNSHYDLEHYISSPQLGSLFNLISKAKHMSSKSYGCRVEIVFSKEKPTFKLQPKTLQYKSDLPIFFQMSLKASQATMSCYFQTELSLELKDKAEFIAIGTTIIGEPEVLLLDEKMRQQLEWHIRMNKEMHGLTFLVHIQKPIPCFVLQTPSILDPKKSVNLEKAVTAIKEKLQFTSTKHSGDLQAQRMKGQQTYGLDDKTLHILIQLFSTTPQFMQLQRTKGVKAKKATSAGGAVVLRYPTQHRSTHCQVNFSQKLTIHTVQPHNKCLLQTNLEKKCLDVHLAALASYVMESWKQVYSIQDNTVSKIFCFGQSDNISVSAFLHHLEHNALYLMNSKLAHQYLMLMWAAPRVHAESLNIISPYTPLPSIPTGVKQVLTDITSDFPISFLKGDQRNVLGWHGLEKMQQQGLALPALTQGPITEFATSPKLTAAKPKSQINVILPSVEILYLDEVNRGWLYSSLTRNFLHQTFKIQIDLKNAQTQAPMWDQLSFPNIQRGLAFGIASKTNTSVSHCWATMNCTHKFKSAADNTTNFLCLCCHSNAVPKTIAKEMKDKLQLDLVKRIIELKLGIIPSPMKKSWNMDFPKKTINLPKTISSGEIGNQVKLYDIQYREQASFKRIHLNLKQKKEAFLWSVYSENPNILLAIIPKHYTPDPVFIEFTEMATAFLSCKLRTHLEWHIKKKRLQQKCQLPAQVLMSRHTFIPLTQELFCVCGRKDPALTVLPLTSNLLFIKEDTQKELDFHIRKLIVQKRFGLSRHLKDSLRSQLLPSSSIDVKVQVQDMKPLARTLPKVSGAFQDMKGSIKTEETLMSLKTTLIRANSYSNHKLEKYITKKFLEVELGMLPTVVQRSLRVAFVTEKSNLPKQIFLNPKFKQRSTSLSFLNPTNLHQLDFNLKYKQCLLVWGLIPHYTEFLKLGMPTFSILARYVQAQRLSIEFSEMETSFLDSKNIEALEWHLTNKKLHQHLGLSFNIQRHLVVLIQKAPNLPQHKIRQHSQKEIEIKRFDPACLSKTTAWMLECHLQKLEICRTKNHVKEIKQSLMVLVTPRSTSNPHLPVNVWGSNRLLRQHSIPKLKYFAVTNTSLSKMLTFEKVGYVKSSSLRPPKMQQQLGVEKQATARVGSLTSVQPPQRGNNHNYCLVRWRNKDKHMAHCSDDAHSVDIGRTEYAVISQSHSYYHCFLTEMSSTIAVLEGTNLPDFYRNQEITEYIEFSLPRRLQMTYLDNLLPVMNHPRKLCKPPTTLSFTDERHQLYTVMINSIYPHLDILQSISPIDLALDFMSVLEIPLVMSHRAHEYIKLAMPLLRSLHTLLPTTDSTLLNENTRDRCSYEYQSQGNESVLDMSSVKIKNILQELEIKFRRLILKRYSSCTSQNKWEHKPPFTIQSRNFTCWYYPFSMSNEPAYELNMPGQFLALNVLDRNMTEELEKELQKQCKNQNRTELPLLDGHQTLTKKLVLIPYRGYNHEIISLCTSRLTSSAGTSLWIDAIETSVFSNSEDVKILSLEFHVKQKIVMNVLSLPHYVIESRLSHQNSLKQKKREETQKIKVALKASMGAAQNLKTETAVDPVARQQNGLVNMNEYLLIHSLETSIRCPTNRPFYERYHCLMPVLRCECLKPKPANQLSPNQIPTKTHYVAAPGLLQSNICSQNPSTQFYAAGSPLPIKSRVYLERNLESKRTNEKPSLRPTGCTDDGPQGQKQIRENNLNNISNIKQKRKNEDTVASLCKKNTLLQTVTSSFRIRLSKMWEEFQDTPITSGVQGIGPVLGRVLDSGNAASPDQNQEPLNDDTVPRANQEKKRKADMACIEPVQLSAMITAQSPSKYTSSRNRRMRNEKSNSSQNPMEKYLISHSEDNADRIGLSKYLKKFNRIKVEQVITTGAVVKNSHNNSHISEKGTSSYDEKESKNWEVLCGKNTGELEFSSWWRGITSTDIPWRHHKVEEKEAVLPGSCSQDMDIRCSAVRSDEAHNTVNYWRLPRSGCKPIRVTRGSKI